MSEIYYGAQMTEEKKVLFLNNKKILKFMQDSQGGGSVFCYIGGIPKFCEEWEALWNAVEYIEQRFTLVCRLDNAGSGYYNCYIGDTHVVHGLISEYKGLIKMFSASSRIEAVSGAVLMIVDWYYNVREKGYDV